METQRGSVTSLQAHSRSAAEWDARPGQCTEGQNLSSVSPTHSSNFCQECSGRAWVNLTTSSPGTILDGGLSAHASRGLQEGREEDPGQGYTAGPEGREGSAHVTPVSHTRVCHCVPHAHTWPLTSSLAASSKGLP